jgi:hypothetical protein
MITTTLNRIRAYGPCADGWQKLLAGLGKTAADDEPLPFARILEINGIVDALWCCRAEPQYAREWRLFAVWCARQVQHLMTDPRSMAALNVAERHAQSQATDGELAEAAAEAWAATWAWDATEAAAAAAAKAWAAEAAAAAAAEAAWAAEAAAAALAVAAEAVAAWAAEAAAAAEAEAAEAEAREKQTAEFLRVVSETEARS